MRLGKALCCAAVRTLSSEAVISMGIFAQFTAAALRQGSHRYVSSFAISRGAKTLCPDLVATVAGAIRRSVAASTNDVGPQTKQVGARFEGQVASAIRPESMRPGARRQFSEWFACRRR